ncbi:MAG: hypothetical protein ACP6IP_10595 [Candidatus Njordarchaeia archaeon]
MYFVRVNSLTELLGDDGLLRLPPYLPESFVLDDRRREAIDVAVRALNEGKNVLISGSPGTGKTALMFMIIRELSKFRGVGYIKEGVSSIGVEHFKQGLVLFYDDLPRMRKEALNSIARNMVRGILATARSEEIALVKRIRGLDLHDYFEVIDLPPLSDDMIRLMLNRYIEAESIKVVDDDAIDLIVKKAQGLPVYVWQVVRELKIKKRDLTVDFAKTIPSGMLDYIDNILWRVLGGKNERYEVLITLLTMTDFAKYSVHQDLYNYIYLVTKERRLGRRVGIEEIMFDETLGDISRYLAREGSTFSFRLPHDSWADVLKGKSNGPMSSEISRINILYNPEKRRELILRAAKRAWHEAVKNADDPFRVDTFKESIRINLGEFALKEVLESEPPELIDFTAVRAQKEIKQEAQVLTILDRFRLLLNRLKVVHKKIIARDLGVTDSELSEILKTSDFHVESKKSGYLYQKNHFLAGMDNIEKKLRKYGYLDLSSAAKENKLFEEDVVENFRGKYTLFNGKIYTFDAILNGLIKKLEAKGFIDLNEEKVMDNMPLKQREKLVKMITEKAPYHPKGTQRFYTKEKVLELSTDIEKHGVIEIGKLANKHGIKQDDIEKLLKEKYAFYEGKIYSPEFIIKTILRELESKGFVDISAYPSLNKLTDTKRRDIMEEIKKIAPIRIDDKDFYLTNRFAKKILVEIKRGDKSLKEVATEYNVPISILESFIKGTTAEKEHALNRIMKLIQDPKIEELKDIIKKLENYGLSKDELNLIGVAKLVLWEKTKNKTFFDQAVMDLEASGTSKAYHNLAIAYAKAKNYKKTVQYLKMSKKEAEGNLDKSLEELKKQL